MYLKSRELRFDPVEEESALGVCARVEGHVAWSSRIRNRSIILLSRFGKLIILRF